MSTVEKKLKRAYQYSIIAVVSCIAIGIMFILLAKHVLDIRLELIEHKKYIINIKKEIEENK